MVEVLGTVGDEIVVLRVLVVLRKFGKNKKIAKKILEILWTILGGDKISEFVNATGGNGIGVVWKHSYVLKF
jgi:hypothetical protein